MYQNIILDWDFSFLPRGKVRVNRLDSHGWVISSHTKNPELSWEFVKYLTGAEGVKYVVDIGDSIPTLKHVAISDDFLHDPNYPNEHNEIFVESINYAYPQSSIVHPKIPYSEMMTRIINPEFEKFYIGLHSSGETLEIIEKKLSKVIQQ